MSLFIPESRQETLRMRLERGQSIELSTVAEEFSVSVDTIRRDLKVLASQGLARRVRGGAMPVSRPAEPALERTAGAGAAHEVLASAALSLIEDGMVLSLDGGSTVLALAQSLPPLPNSLVVTPAPAVALACLAAGIDTQLVGGRLSKRGAICVGHGTVTELSNIAADLVFLGVCTLHTDFGLGADDLDEAHVKRAMAEAGNRVIAMTSAVKLGHRARHRVIACDALDVLITDADPSRGLVYEEKNLEVIYA